MQVEAEHDTSQVLMLDMRCGQGADAIERPAFQGELTAVLPSVPIRGEWIEIWSVQDGRPVCKRRLAGLPYGTTTVTWHDFEVKKSDTNITEKF